MPAAAESTDVKGLPPILCVETLRSARIEAGRGQAEESWRRLEAAVDLPGCDLAALAELLHSARRVEIPSEQRRVLLERLASQITNPHVTLPAGMISYLEHSLTAQDREPLLAALGERRERQRLADRTPTRDELEEILTVTADLQELLGQPERARDSLSQLLALSPTEALRWRALALDEQLERWQSVSTLLDEMLKATNPPEFLRRLQVLSLAHLGRYDEMVIALDGLAPNVPPSTSGQDSVGEAPPHGFVGLLLEAAWALRDAGRDTEAEATFRRALTVDPQAPEAQSALLHLYGTAEERAAQETATAERRRAESDPVALYEEGSELLAAGDAEAARGLLSRAAPMLDGTPFAEAAWYNLGIAAYRLKLWEQAATAFQEAVVREPDRAESHYQRGMSQYQLGRCTEALVSLQRTLELSPDKYQAYYYLAACHQALGQHEAAERNRQLYRQNNPN
jgi:tetratricopeptide (TPR) repeat protein